MHPTIPSVGVEKLFKTSGSLVIDPQRERFFTPLTARIACVIATLLFFGADLVLPRGATPAIGYCFIPVLARVTGQRRLLLWVTGICTLLTWIGYALEPLGAAWWMSVFDRAMVSGVLWLTLLLVWRRMEAEALLAQHAQALRAAVRELNRSNNELQNFASIVSHDIRGPLNTLALIVRLISERASIQADQQCSEWIASMLAEIARISSMIERLLTYGRVGAGDVKRIDCDCEAVLQSVRRMLRAQIEDASAQITNDPLPTVQADPALIAELLQNLIENSIKYRSSASPLIHVAATSTLDGWRFSLQDNGLGIHPEDASRVFDPFYRGTGAQSSPGAGLGLATCKRIVERHGGVIEAHSNAGQGCTFSFTIPNHPSPDPSPARSE